MAGGKTLTVYLAADLKKFNSGMKQAETGLKGFGDKLSSFIGPALIAAGAAAGAFATKIAVDAVGAASDLAETQNKVGVIFGDSSRSILDFAENAVTALGQTRTQALEASATFAQFGKSAGLSGASLVNFSTELVTLSADLASFNNSSPEEAITAIGSALRGEAEPMRRFGVLLDDATLKARAMQMGIYEGSGALTQQQKVLAAHQEILAQTGDAQGDFARTADGLANTQRILQAAVEDAKAEIGEGLVDAIEAATGAMGGSQGMASAIKDGGQVVGDFTRGVGVLVGQLADLTEGLRDNSDAAENTTEEQNALTTAAELYLIQLNLLVPGIGNVTGALVDQGAEMRTTSEAANSLYDSTIALAKAQRFAAYDTAQAKKDLIATSYDSGIAQKKEAEWTRKMTELLGHVPGYIAPVDEKTKKLTSSRGAASAATKELTKDEKKLIQAYEDGETALAKRGDQLLAEVDNLKAARTAITDYTTAMSENILSGINLGTAYEAQFNAEGEKTGASLIEGFNAQIAQAEWFGNVLNEIKRQKADVGLIDHIASLGPETGGALAQQMIDEGLVPELSKKWVDVNKTVNGLADTLVPEGLIAGEKLAISTVQGLAEGIQKDQKSLAKLGKQVGKIVGAKFKAQLADDVAEAIRSVEAQATAARAEAIATAKAQQAVITDQAVAQAISQIITRGDQRLGQLTRPLVA